MQLAGKKRKIIKLMILTALILFIPSKVNASYTMGDYVKNQTTLNTGVTIWNNGSNCNGVICNATSQVITPFKVTCGNETECFIKFPAIPGYINNANGNFQMGGQVLQIYAGTRYNICEIDEGIATCLIPANENVTNVEFKYNNIYTTMAGVLWYEMYEIQVFKQPGDIEGIVNNINNTQNLEMQQNQTNWNNFNNADISQQTQTPIDDSGIQSVEQQEQTQVNQIQTALNNITPQTFDLTDFSLTFAWIWQTIIYLFTTHSILMTTMIIVLSLGFVKTIFGR